MYINNVIQDGSTALIYASKGGHLAVVKYLVQQFVAIDAQDKVRNCNNYYLSDYHKFFNTFLTDTEGNHCTYVCI